MNRLRWYWPNKYGPPKLQILGGDGIWEDVPSYIADNFITDNRSKILNEVIEICNKEIELWEIQGELNPPIKTISSPFIVMAENIKNQIIDLRDNHEKRKN